MLDMLEDFGYDPGNVLRFRVLDHLVAAAADSYAFAIGKLVENDCNLARRDVDWLVRFSCSSQVLFDPISGDLSALVLLAEQSLVLVLEDGEWYLALAV